MSDGLRYISDGSWFIKGSIVILIDDYRPRVDCGLFRGLRQCENPLSGGHDLGAIRTDEEVCPFSEFTAVIEVPK